MGIRVTLQIMNNALSPSVKRQVNVVGVLDLNTSAEEAARQLVLAWDRVVTPIQIGLAAVNAPIEPITPEDEQLF